MITLQSCGRQWGKVAADREALEQEAIRLLEKYGSLEIIQHKTYVEAWGIPSPQEEAWRATLS